MTSANPLPAALEIPTPTRGGACRAADIAIAVAPVSPAHTNRDVFAIFEAQPELIGLPVVEDGRPVGLINRNIFMQSLARPFHREIYWHKSCIAFMDKTPFVAEADTSIQDLSFQVLEAGTKTLIDGFLIAARGRYVGVGLAHDMLRAVAMLQAEKNRLVMESIDYGSVIQRSLSRASREAMRSVLPDHFLLWEPRDVVSGDFYHFQDFDDGFLLALYDCTGHGVPGAFMTLIMASFLQGAIDDDSRRDPAGLLGAINRRVKSAMDQIDHAHSAADGEREHQSDDGMDAAFCWFDRATRRLTWAGARLQLYVLAPDADEVACLDGERHGVGYAGTPMDQCWHNQTLELAPGSCVYLFTDGLLDQLGGDKRIAFGRRRLRATLLEHRSRSLPEQRSALVEALHRWQGDEVRKDDVSAIGFRV
jgi:sigma-B regulation protein RsbU (phosphoserine phosphatase)